MKAKLSDRFTEGEQRGAAVVKKHGEVVAQADFQFEFLTHPGTKSVSENLDKVHELEAFFGD